MCDRGEALCLMGNHELNALYFHAKGRSGNWLRHHGDRNARMHAGTLGDFPDYKNPGSEWQTIWLPWMKRLPMFLDLGTFRAIHAAWVPDQINRLADHDFSDRAFFEACSDKATPEGEAVETLLKGIEAPLPSPHTFQDHTGAIRDQFRARWWEHPADNAMCADLVFPANTQIKNWRITPTIREMLRPYPADSPPVFFGHYFKPANSPLAPEAHNVACLDYSAASVGPLVAYRWNGEAEIKSEHYVTFHET